MNNKPTVLITDDYHQNIAQLTDILLSINSTLIINCANEGELAIKAVQDKIDKTGTSFDLIFMDYQMPGINGEEATTKIRQLEKEANCKSIIITWSSAREAPFPNADDWLPKPPRKEEVEYLLSVYCN